MSEKKFEEIFDEYHEKIDENEGLLDDSLISKFLERMNEERDKLYGKAIYP